MKRIGLLITGLEGSGKEALVTRWCAGFFAAEDYYDPSGPMSGRKAIQLPLNSHSPNRPGASSKQIMLDVDVDPTSEASQTAVQGIMFCSSNGIIITYSVQSRSSFAAVRKIHQSIVRCLPDPQQHPEVDPDPTPWGPQARDSLSSGIEGIESTRRGEKAAMEVTEARKAVVNSQPKPKPELPMYLVGTKADNALQEEPEGMVALRQVLYSEGQALAEELGCVGFCECSAKDDRGCDTPFNEMARIILEQEALKPKPKPKLIITNLVEKKQRSGCFGGRLGRRMFCR